MELLVFMGFLLCLQVLPYGHILIIVKCGLKWASCFNHF